MANPKVKKVKVISFDGKRTKYIVPRLANNAQFMRENEFMIADEPTAMDDMVNDEPTGKMLMPTEAEPTTADKLDDPDTKEFEALNARDLVSKIKTLTTIKVLKKLYNEEQSRGDNARKTVLTAIEKRFENIQ